MSVEILDGSTIQSFVDDEGAFNSSVDGRFAALDADRDGLLSYSEMAGELMSLRVLERHFGVDEAAVGPDELVELYRGLFARFDRDGNGKVDLHEFRAEMREVMLAVASGLGFLPAQMVVEEVSQTTRSSTSINSQMVRIQVWGRWRLGGEIRLGIEEQEKGNQSNCGWGRSSFRRKKREEA